MTPLGKEFCRLEKLSQASTILLADAMLSGNEIKDADDCEKRFLKHPAQQAAEEALLIAVASLPLVRHTSESLTSIVLLSP